MSVMSALRPLVYTRRRRETLLALTAAYMLVQLSSLPVAIALPTIAKAFDTGVDDAAWLVIIYLMMLGAFVLLGARMGDRFGHARIFFFGIVLSTVGSGLIALSQELWHIVGWRAVAGLGSAMVMGNANAILAANFAPNERGRAFAVPIIGARFGTLIGLAFFGVLLQFLNWQLVFLTFVPLGVLSIFASLPMVRSQTTLATTERDTGPVDWLGGILLVAAGVVLVLSGSHLHGGEESYVSNDALSYHIPMHLLFVLMLVVFLRHRAQNVQPHSGCAALQERAVLAVARHERNVPLLHARHYDAGACACGGRVRDAAALRNYRAAAKPDAGAVHADGGGMGLWTDTTRRCCARRC